MTRKPLRKTLAAMVVVALVLVGATAVYSAVSAQSSPAETLTDGVRRGYAFVNGW